MKPASYYVAVLMWFCCIQNVLAADYYVSSSSGNDNYSGTKSTAPWKTLAKVNAATLNPGDRVLFRAGNQWSGILLPKTGVIYSRYGQTTKTPNPVLLGSVNVGSLNWNRYKGSIYVADVASLVQEATDVNGAIIPAGINQLFYNTTRLQRARYPNEGKGVFGIGKNRYLRIGIGTPTQDGETQTLMTETNALPSTVTSTDLAGAQVLARNEDWYLTRYDVLSSSADKTQLNLQADPTWPGSRDYPLHGNNGYWLENKLWMLDQAGEWVYDAPSKKLYVWLPGNGSPKGKSLRASVFLNAVQARNVDSLLLDGLKMAETNGDAVAIAGANTVSLSNLKVYNAGAKGISATASPNASGQITDSEVVYSINQGIDVEWTHINILRNTVKHAGIGYFAWAAVWLGSQSTASGNTIEGSSYIALRGTKANQLEGNHILNSCMEFSDCGGIYVLGRDGDGRNYGLPYANDVGSTIRNNFVVGAPLSTAVNRLDGLPANATSAANGIYLDDYSGAVTIENNYVSGLDRGIMLHLARTTAIRGNTLVGNEAEQIAIPENWYPDPLPCDDQPDCDTRNYIRGNLIENNIIAGSPKSPQLLMEMTDYEDVADFASFTGNIYAMHGSIVLERHSEPDSSGIWVADTLRPAQWQTTGKDSNSTWFATTDEIKATSTNLILNGTFDNGSNNWWPQNAEPLIVGIAGCHQGSACLTVQPAVTAEPVDDHGRYVFLVYSADHPIAIQKNTQYMVVFDAMSNTAGDQVTTLFRREDGQAEYSSAETVNVNTEWSVHKAILTSRQSANDVRLDLQFLAKGTVRIDNVRVFKVSNTSGKAYPVGFYNPTTTVKSFACPQANATACKQYIDARTRLPIKFPLTLNPMTSRVILFNSARWIDNDLDGVPGDTQTGGLDRCPLTPGHATSNEAGCSINQR